MYRLIVLACVLTGSSAFAAQISSETTENGAKTRWSVINISSAGVVRIDEGGWSASVSAPAAGSLQSSSVQFTRTEIRDTIIYNPQSAEVMSVEGDICRVLSADSAPPPGLGFMNSPEMAEHQTKMQGAMAEAMQQMEDSGMSQREIDAMKELMGGMAMPGMQPPSKPSYSFELLDSSASVGSYRGRLYSISDQHGTERYRVVMVPVDDVPGGRKARDGMDGMMNVFRQYMQGSGLPGGYGDALMEVMQDAEFSADYPARIEDLQQNSTTEIVAASSDAADVVYEPQCERRGMMEP